MMQTPEQAVQATRDKAALYLVEFLLSHDLDLAQVRIGPIVIASALCDRENPP